MNFKVALLGGVVFAVSATAGQAALAQDRANTIEEVVVTARKREESLQRVPLAVSSVTGENLEMQGIRQPSDLGRMVPSLASSPGDARGTVNAASFSLRGQISADVLLNLSQPVGLYEDSVNIPHPVGSNGAFFDVARVEVLKGPQGTLYGRNTTGGAVNIITRAPDFNGVHGYVLGEAGNDEDYRFGGAVNVPIVNDVLALRAVYMHWNRDSYGRSSVTGQGLGGDHDDDLARLSIRLAPIDSKLTADIKLEWYKADRNGPLSTPRSFNVASAPGAAAALEAALYDNFALNAGRIATGNSAAAIAAGSASILACINGDLFTSCQGTRTRDNVESRHAVFDLNWDITDTLHLRSLTGYHGIRSDRVFDLDGLRYQILEVGIGVGGIQPNLGSAPQPPPKFPFELPLDQESKQVSQEFNLSGTFMERLKWLVGAFWADDRGAGASQSLRFPVATSLRGGVLGDGHTQFSVTNSTWALFTQNDIKFTDKVSVTLGARYTEERLGQILSDWQYNTTTRLFSCTAGALALSPPKTNLESCSISNSAKFSGTSYLASLNLQLTPDHLLYFKTARGFRGGALQARDADAPAAGPEIAVDYEIGFKGDFLDKRLRTNVAIYQTNYSNKQEQRVTINRFGIPGNILQNAAQARVRGAELEVIAQPVRGLTLFTSGSYTNAKYLDYKNAITLGGPGGTLLLIDASGIEFTMPKYQADIGGRYEMKMGPGLLSVQADYAYQSKIPITPLSRSVLTPLALQKELFDSVGLVNARIEYSLRDLGLTVGLFATNLTNKQYQIASVSAPGTGGVQNALTQEPRMWGISVRKSFGGE